MQATIQSLADRLLKCTDETKNVQDMAGALEVITQLEKVTISKEVLEATRLGKIVNEIRRSNSESHPDLAKRCRGLIKSWQSIISSGGGSRSGSTSRNGTPASQQGISPGIRNRLTPGLTPKPHIVSPLVTSEIRSRSTTPGSSGTSGGRMITPSGRQVTPAGRTVTPGGRRVTPGVHRGNPAHSPRTGTGLTNGSADHAWLTDSYAPSASGSGQPGSPKTNSTSKSPNGESGGIKLKIRIGGGKDNSSTTIVERTISPANSRTSPNSSANKNSTPQVEDTANRRKRKLSHCDSEGSLLTPPPLTPGADILAGSSPAIGTQLKHCSFSQPQIATHCNGSSTSPPDTPGISLDGTRFPAVVSNSDLSSKKRGRKRKEKSPPLNIIPKLPGRPPKQKTTAEILADYNKSLPEEMSISLEGAKDRSSPLRVEKEEKRINYRAMIQSDSEGDDIEYMDPKKKRGRKSKRESPQPEDLNATKRQRLESFLEDSARSTSPTSRRSHLHQNFASNRDAATNLVQKNGKTNNRNNASSPALFPSSRKLPQQPSTSEDPTQNSTEKPEEPEVASKKSPDWYLSLPPLDPEMVRAIRGASEILPLEEVEEKNEECAKMEEELATVSSTPEDAAEPAESSQRKNIVRLSPSQWRNSESANGEQSLPVPDLRSRFERNEGERLVLGMPYIDIGIPDFIEYNFPGRSEFLSELNFVYRPPVTGT